MQRLGHGFLSRADLRRFVAGLRVLENALRFLAVLAAVLDGVLPVESCEMEQEAEDCLLGSA